MKFRKRKKFICVVTAVLLWFSGICFDVHHAGSAFAYGKTPLSANNFLNSPDTSGARELCVPTTLGQRVIASVTRSSQRSSRRNLTRSEVLLISDGIISVDPNFSCGTVLSGMEHTSSSHAVIVGYIHHQDGQK